ncbi:hypothetical protein CapIbe_002492 [Capra ibex]
MLEIVMHSHANFQATLKECLVHIEALKKSINCFSLNNASLWHKESHLINDLHEKLPLDFVGETRHGRSESSKL